jgi:HK97 family phage major capsid protein
MTDINQTVQQINAAIETFKTTQAELTTNIKTLAEGSDKVSKEALTKADALATKIAGISTSIVEMEQKLADGVMKGTEKVSTLGNMVIQSDAFKQYAAGNTSKFRIEANTIIGQEGSPAENSDTLVAPQRLSGIIPGAFRALRVRDVLPQGTTSSNMVEYTRELAFTNNAAERNEGVAKPESSLTFELKNAPVRTIAHFLKVSKQVLEDAAALQSYIDTRLRYGVELKYDSQLINGNGTAPAISGMLDSGNYTAFTQGPFGETALDNINRAIYQVLAADYAATGIIMNPADWGAIERLKGDDDHYIIGNAQGNIGPRLWGLPVVVTNNLAAGKFICGAFDIAYQVWNRSGTVVEMFEQDSDNVQKNLVTVRAEARGCLASYRPASVVYGDLVTAASA